MPNETARAFDETLSATLGRIDTTYSDRDQSYKAVLVLWDTISDFLGRDHDGSADDDQTLIDALIAGGAPDWVRDAEGWVDSSGWGLIGPRIECYI